MIAALVLGGVLGIGLTLVVTRRRALARDLALVAALEDAAGLNDEPSGERQALRARLSRSVSAMRRHRDDADRAVTRLEGALDRMADGIVVCDDGGRVVFTNAAGAVLADARHEDALVAAAVTECLSSSVEGRPEERSVELFGPPARTLTVAAEPLGDPAAPSGAVATITDLSRLRRLESVRSDFVANVSHELKTPIGGLAILAEALADTIDPEERDRLGGRLLHEAHRVSRVVDDLLALSEIEADPGPRREPVACEELIARVQAEVAVLADGFGVDVETSVAEDLHVVGDAVQLSSAVSNLVENAIKYSGGSTPVTLDVRAEGSFVRVTVADRGIGIPQGDLDRVFERFYRVDQARSRATGGTGLGLAIVRNVVEGHGGTIDLTSREGEGTTVQVRLPLAASRRSLHDGDPSVGPPPPTGASA